MAFKFNPLTGQMDMVSDPTPGDDITSTPGSGEYQVTDIRLDADKKILVKYNEEAEE